MNTAFLITLFIISITSLICIVVLAKRIIRLEEIVLSLTFVDDDDIKDDRHIKLDGFSHNPNNRRGVVKR